MQPLPLRLLPKKLKESGCTDACAKERIAGIRVDEVRQAAYSIAKCLQVLHAGGLVHGDLKQRNVLRVGSRRRGWVLCDMDAATPVGDIIGSDKTSTAYCPPELAETQFADGPDVTAETSFDVWSFGVVLFELCSGQTLFSQDISNDELIAPDDQTRLCTWNIMSDAELAPVFSAPDVDFGTLVATKQPVGSNATPRAGQSFRRPRTRTGIIATASNAAAGQIIVRDAKNLIRWCLSGNPSERPTVEEILKHHFIAPEAPTPVERPMRYYAFTSHAQQDASGTANTLFFALERLGLHSWIDMRQDDLTLAGMRSGVINSDIFLMILTEKTLLSWYCVQELLCAVEHAKPIQILLELEPRFYPFSLAKWEQGKLSGNGQREITVKNEFGEPEQRVVSVKKDGKHPWQQDKSESELTKMLCAAVDAALENAVAYRRRDFEQEAMMRELCRRNNKRLPDAPNELLTLLLQRTASKDRSLADLPRPSHVSADGKATILVLCNDATVGTMLTDLEEGVREANLESLLEFRHWSNAGLDRTSTAHFSSADKLLLLLSEGVLTQPVLVEQLEKAVKGDRQQHRERLCIIYGDSWQFGGPETQAAPEAIKLCFELHEALTYRPRDPQGRLRHEFPAMLRRLMQSLGVFESQGDGGVLSIETELIPAEVAAQRIGVK